MKRHLFGVAAAVLGTMLVGGVVVQTAAAAPVPVVPTTVTLPLFGAPLTIGIETGPGGTLTNVTIDPADGTATKARPHKVVFESADPLDPANTAKVTIKTKHGGQSVSARAGSLLEISGPGGWSGDLFGTGVATTVAFIIGGTGDIPDITGVTSSDATADIGDVKLSTGDDDDESSASARVSIKFTSADGAQSRTVTISARVKTDDDGDTSAKLSISLGRVKGVAVDAAAAAGPHTWTGVLCDGTAATIAYTVAEDGSVSAVSATPDGADVRTDDSKIDVRFSNDERVRIKVRENDGLIKISVDERIRCRDAADPTVNGSAVPTTVDDDDDGDDDGHHGRGGDDNDDDDDTTSTTDVTTTSSG
jgi:hypothetical protein